jgi:hypothetical protein
VRPHKVRPQQWSRATPPTLASVIVGARNEEQLRRNLSAVGWNLTREQVAKLDAASALPSAYPYWHQVSVRRSELSANSNLEDVNGSHRNRSRIAHTDYRAIGQ